MSKFDVYANPDKMQREITPWLVDVQSDLLRDLDTRVVVPLRKRSAVKSQHLPANLMPEFVIENEACVLETSKLAAIPKRALGQPRGSLASDALTITAALDFLFFGF